ncbi:MAG: hypothetical protein K1X89_21625 [Myxococcaceae bacterium]|nr:hypothetical protein [Myxococcaceae bacterium]
MSFTLRPLSVGEQIDRAASLWRANVGLLFRLFLGFELAQFTIIKVWSELSLRWFPLAAGGVRFTEALKSAPEEVFRQLGGMMATGGVAFMVAFLGSSFAGVAAAHLLMPVAMGKAAPTLAEGLGRAWQRRGVVLSTYALSFGAGLLATVVSLLPGAAVSLLGVLADSGAASVALVVLGTLLAMLGALLAVLWWILRVAVISQVVAVEDLGAWASFKRAGTLVAGRVEPGLGGLLKLRLAGLITVVGLILLVVSWVLGLPALGIQVYYGHIFDPAHADPAAIPQLLLVPAQLLQVIAQTAVAPLFPVATTLHYLDVRVRREALDLVPQAPPGAS